MKKRTMLMALTIFCLIFISLSWSICVAENDIYGCYKVKNGNLRIVDDHNECKKSEKAITFPGEHQPGPNEFTVDCGKGETVAEALNQAPPTGIVTVKINGVCEESVTIYRNAVTLEGLNSDAVDGFLAPSNAQAAILINGAHWVRLNNLKLTGPAGGIYATSNATFDANDLIIEGTQGQTGVALDLNASGRLTNCTITDSDHGVAVVRGSSLRVLGGKIIRSLFFGVSASASGSVTLEPRWDPTDGAVGVVVQDSGFHGVTASSGGSVECFQCTVENSGGTGVFAFSGGTVNVHGDQSLIQNNGEGGVGANNGRALVDGGAHVSDNSISGVSGFNGGVVTLQGEAVLENNEFGLKLSVGSSAVIQDRIVIQNNTEDGVFLEDTSTARIHGSFEVGGVGNKIINNGGWGINCAGHPSVAQIQEFGESDISGILGRINPECLD